jgi:hypothetical protein
MGILNRCKHRRTKYRLMAWACKTRSHGHEQGFTTALTCRDCGAIVRLEGSYPHIGGAK